MSQVRSEKIPAGIRLLEPGYVVVDQFGCGGVVADYDEYRWRSLPGVLPPVECALIVRIEGVQRRQEFGRQPEWVQGGGILTFPLFGASYP